MQSLKLLFVSALAVVAVCLAYFGLLFSTPSPPDPVTVARAQAIDDFESGRFEFLSWYNGWSNHNVWGIGEVSALAAENFAHCGDLVVSARPIYDSHTDIVGPRVDQTREYAETYNLTMRGLIERDGTLCTFLYTSRIESGGF